MLRVITEKTGLLSEHQQVPLSDSLLPVDGIVRSHKSGHGQSRTSDGWVETVAVAVEL